MGNTVKENVIPKIFLLLSVGELTASQSKKSKQLISKSHENVGELNPRHLNQVFHWHLRQLTFSGGKMGRAGNRSKTDCNVYCPNIMW
ncbi:hypothetical protein HanPI659440_Chr13g0499801 [Helianthus annuus]|nr:hypothetical protein HanPI659440_Chr13g0499801 [Helianthus annuus]